MSYFYEDGVGTEIDEKSAFKYAKQAADQGNAVEQYRVSYCYKNGIGTEIDEKSAFKYAKQAAERCNAIAQNYVGFFYENGIGTKKDEKLAFEHYKQAADQGLALAQHNVGCCYAYGKGTEKNDKLAFEYFKKAADQRHALAQNDVGNCYAEGRGTEKDEKLAFENYGKAADQGDAVAQCNVGSCYAEGKGTKKDEKLAFEYIRKAAGQGDVVAQKYVGHCYENGIGTTKDYFAAITWLSKAGDENAQAQLRKFYYPELISEKESDLLDQEAKKIVGQTINYPQALALNISDVRHGLFFSSQYLGVSSLGFVVCSYLCLLPMQDFHADMLVMAGKLALSAELMAYTKPWISLSRSHKSRAKSLLEESKSLVIDRNCVKRLSQMLDFQIRQFNGEAKIELPPDIEKKSKKPEHWQAMKDRTQDRLYVICRLYNPFFQTSQSVDVAAGSAKPPQLKI